MRRHFCGVCRQEKKRAQMVRRRGYPGEVCSECAKSGKVVFGEIKKMIKAGPTVKSTACREAGPGLKVSSHDAFRKICEARSKPSLSAGDDAESPAGFWCRTCEIGPRLMAGEDVLPDNVGLLEAA
ncbi:MAG: hypothetical protein OEV64_10770 [Desulfobulbaceae bacterium]|nr:hypothetical protein [Desulfobulbaceae bacterium]